jgi:hypothetical protein
MIDYLRDIQPLEGDLSDAEIAIHISTRTARPISATAARDALLESGAVVVDPVTGNRIGPLIQHYSSLTDGQDKVLLAWFLNYVFGEGIAIETNSYPRSVQFAAVEGGLPAGIAPVAAAIVIAAGGRPDPSTNAAKIVASRDEYEAQKAAEEADAAAQEALWKKVERFNEMYNQYISPLVAGKVIEDSAWSAALQEMSDNFSL